jgi:putative restriction endonuclease
MGVSVWKRGSERAPHKPLLLLLALAAVQRGEDRLIRYTETDRRLSQLLVEFGPPRKSHHPEYPFWRLQNDGDFWEIPERRKAIERRGPRKRSADVPARILREVEARGGFTAQVFEELGSDPALVNKIAASILEEHFPASLHQSILDAVGMPWVPEGSRPRERSGEFRAEVLRLYEHRCAVCGFDGRLGVSDLALEAAHMKWVCHGGPDTPQNGLLLCTLHHRALDRGAIGLSANRQVLVSQHLHGGDQVREMFLRFSGQDLREPLVPSARLAESFIGWHRREVFRDPPRLT